jgi:histidinol dehydrogenase
VEHAPDNVGFLVTLSEGKMREILAEVERQLQGAPRANIIRAALAADSLAIVARDESEAIDLINLIAPEHLTLAVSRADQLMPYAHNAGCVLLGPYSPQSGADYVFGPSHTLPTGGAARWQSPLNVLDFLKIQSMIGVAYIDLEPMIPAIEAMGDLEGLPAHARGATIRRRSG